jgi:4-hydroxy-tetrahydrodipicolinate synthase
MCYESFVMGAQGFVCMLGNIAPGMCVDMFNAVVEEKDYKKGYEIYRKALPVFNHLESFPKVVQLIKYLIEKQGRVGGYIRRPRLELTEEEKQFIDENIDISQLY